VLNLLNVFTFGGHTVHHLDRQSLLLIILPVVSMSESEQTENKFSLIWYSLVSLV
jgi:hypothetical protein